jgi:hypothetical protein
MVQCYFPLVMSISQILAPRRRRGRRRRSSRRSRRRRRRRNVRPRGSRTRRAPEREIDPGEGSLRRKVGQLLVRPPGTNVLKLFASVIYECS